MSDKVTYVTVHNIPKEFRSVDLRNFFSLMVETGVFRCFHFRHRPEVQKPVDGDQSNQKRQTCCCVVMIWKTRVDEFISTYNDTFWVKKNGESSNSKCFIRRISIADDSTREKTYTKHTNETLSRSDLRTLIELRPPPALPAGNVGTPTKYILKQINECKFPSKLIKQLGLEFPRFRAKGMYGSVPLNYQNSNDEPSTSKGRNRVPARHPAPDLSGIPTAEQVMTFTRTKKGHIITRSQPTAKNSQVHDPDQDNIEEPPKEDKQPESDDDDAEEWDRHEALHNDVTSQGRTKERLFEEDMEVVWEKGGSGLVFYTDAQHWDEAEGDFDAKTSDDWDIDMSGYYRDGVGDKDARDFLSMQNAKAIKKGELPTDENRVGFFEKFTKGIGRRILEQQGWKPGRGVGAQEGISEPISDEGQHPKDRSGFGFRGDKLERDTKKKKRYDYDEIQFSSVYDERFRDEGHGLQGRSESSNILKYRKKFIKDTA